MHVAIFSWIFIALVAITILSVLAGKLYYTRRQLREMEDALTDVEEGNGNRKILASQGDLTAGLAYKMNSIISSYEEQIAVMRRTDETNKQLMTNLSHDVRTPLTTLLGYLDAAHRGIVTGKERDDYIETARKKAHNLKDYIDVLFEWFKLNSDELIFAMKPVEATELTRTVLKEWIPIFEEHDLDFDIEIPEHPCIVCVDEDGFTRVLNNLVQNVISHSRASEIDILMQVTNQRVEIKVSDNGIGISGEDVPYIFDRLYKCDKGRSESGSGLGLSITQQIVEKMSGTISIQSIPKKRTTFTIKLPLVREETHAVQGRGF